MKDEDGTTGVRSRTRRAILDAAIQVLGQNSAASLGDIAQAADVGRTTLHRYFPSRTELLQALSIDALEQIQAATDRARMDEGTAASALERLCQEYFDLGELLMLVFNTPEITKCEGWYDESETDRKVLALVTRGQAEGSIDPGLPAPWITNELMWSNLYAGWEFQRRTEATRHEALRCVILTIGRAITPPG